MNLSVAMDMLLRKRFSRVDFGQRRTRQRIVDAILDTETLEERNRLLGEVAVRCRRAWVGKSPEQALLLKQHSDALFSLLAERILNEGHVDLFLASEYTSHGLVMRDGVDSSAMFTRSGEYSELEFQYYGRMVFDVAFFRFVGSTLERSLQFALALLERLDAVWQSVVDDPERYDREQRWSESFVDRFGVSLREAIRMAEQDPETFRRLMAERGYTAEDAEREGPAFVIGRHGWEMAAAQRLFIQCATTPSTDRMPGKQWIERIIEAAAGGHAGADDALRAFVVFLTMLRGDGRFVMIEQDDAGSFDADALLGGLFDGSIPQEYSTPVLVLRGEYKRMVLAWSDRERRQNETHHAKAVEEIRWFQAHQDEAIKATERRMEEIRTRPRRAILPNGADHVDISITALRQVGIRTIVFHAEDHEFPDVGLDILVRCTTPHLIRHRASLLKIDMLPDGMFQGGDHFRYPDELRVLLRTVVVDVLHRIVVGDRELRERRQPSKVTLHGDAAVLDLAPIIRKRRAHLRRLPVGKQASPEARVFASELRWKLPPGMTFVRAYYEEEQIVYDLPTEPTAVYTDDDLFDLGGDGT